MKLPYPYQKKSGRFANAAALSCFQFTRHLALFCVLFVVSGPARSQCIAPTLKFHSPILESGTDKATGAVYRFPGVIAGVDATVEIMGIYGGATLYNIDDSTGIGYYDAFQPYVGAAPGDTSYIEWKIVFKVAGTAVDTSLGCLAVTGVDVDGDGANLKEFVEAATPGSFSVDPLTNLQVSFDGVRSKAISPVANIPLIDTAHREAMFQMNFTNISTLLYRNGAISTYGSEEIRQTCIYFKPFFDTYFLLPVKLLSFTARPGSAGVMINWSAANEQDNSSYTLERSGDGVNWSAISTLMTRSASAVSYYAVVDRENTNAVTCYRLKQVDKNGRITYSAVIRLAADAPSSVRFISNTRFGASITLQATLATAGSYTAELFSPGGGSILRRQLRPAAGNNRLELAVPASLARGIYFLSISDNHGEPVYHARLIRE